MLVSVTPYTTHHTKPHVSHVTLTHHVLPYIVYHTHIIPHMARVMSQHTTYHTSSYYVCIVQKKTIKLNQNQKNGVQN